MELGLAKRKEIYGGNSEELLSACKLVGKTCNHLAQKYMHEGNVDAGFEFLKRGENIIRCDPVCLQITYNNMASLYRQKRDLKSAQRYLNLALDLEHDISESNNIRKAQIQLNICAVTSQLGKHKAALKQAEAAITLLEESLLPHLKDDKENNQSNSLGLIQEDLQDVPSFNEDEGKRLTEDEKSQYLETLVIAYYNAGVEQEHMHQFNLSHYCYQNGLKVATLNFPDNHVLVKTLQQSSKSVVKKIVKSNFQ